ncbi:MAG: hypothetical protein NTZ05_04270 [Chloroflexi bacterium]|nr:hypothetical protein [Chloroflexota bacterium]
MSLPPLTEVVLRDPSYRMRLVEGLAASSKSWSKEDREHIAHAVQEYSAAVAGRTPQNAYVALFLRSANEAIRGSEEFGAFALQVWGKRQRKTIEMVAEAVARRMPDGLMDTMFDETVADLAKYSKKNPRDVALVLALLALAAATPAQFEAAAPETEDAPQ